MTNFFQKLSASSIMNKVVFGVASLSLVSLIGFGTVAAQSGTTSISGTGYGSNNSTTVTNTTTTTVTNTNNVNISNSTSQSSTSGNVSTSGNTTGGSATSGSTSNSSSSSVSITISNNPTFQAFIRWSIRVLKGFCNRRLFKLRGDLPEVNIP